MYRKDTRAIIAKYIVTRPVKPYWCGGLDLTDILSHAIEHVSPSAM